LASSPEPSSRVPTLALSEDQLKEKIAVFMKECWGNKDVDDCVLSFKEVIGDGGESYVLGAVLVQTLVTLSLERKESSDREVACKVLERIHQEGMLTTEAIETGMQRLCGDLEDQICDVPKAYDYAGWWLSQLVTSGLIRKDSIETILASVPTDRVSSLRDTLKT